MQPSHTPEPWGCFPAPRQGHTQADAPFSVGLKLPPLEGHQTGLHAALKCCARSLQTSSEQKHLKYLMSSKKILREGIATGASPLLPASTAPLPSPELSPSISCLGILGPIKIFLQAQSKTMLSVWAAELGSSELAESRATASPQQWLQEPHF